MRAADNQKGPTEPHYQCATPKACSPVPAHVAPAVPQPQERRVKWYSTSLGIQRAMLTSNERTVHGAILRFGGVAALSLFRLVTLRTSPSRDYVVRRKHDDLIACPFGHIGYTSFRAH